MQIVIDISEDDFRKVQDGRASVSMMRKAIRNGTPLPKGHGELIDKNLIVNEMEQAYKNSLSEPFAKLFVDFMAYIDDAPTIVKADKGESEEEK